MTNKSNENFHIRNIIGSNEYITMQTLSRLGAEQEIYEASCQQKWALCE